MIICHQKLAKDAARERELSQTLFGELIIEPDIKNAECKEISLSTAAKVIQDYEYLGTMCNAPICAFGIYFSGNLGGVVVFGAVSPPSVASSVYPKDTSKVIQLSRGASVYWSHPHTSSKLIAYSLNKIKSLGYRVVIAYSDPDAGEIGTVYQATNWLYCGMTAVRPDYLENGKRKVGHFKKGEAATLTKTKRTRKHKYVFVLGDKRERKQIKRFLKWEILKEYPKRQIV